MIDSLFPGSVPMSRVNWDAKSEYEYVNNYKLLQGSFGKLKIDKPVDVNKLIRAKYQDNLEFMQWLKAYYEMHQPVDGYDAVAQRQKGKGGARYFPGAPGAARAPRAAAPREPRGAAPRAAAADADAVPPPPEKENRAALAEKGARPGGCLLYTSPSPRDATLSRMPSSA